MTTIPPLPRVLVEPIVRRELREDLGRAGDITTEALVPETAMTSARIVAREGGVVAGSDVAGLVFELLDPATACVWEHRDGARIESGAVIARIEGKASAILTAERTALNFLSHLSGVATATATLVAAVRPHPTRVTCTRKTTPGLRALQKRAVRAGGGFNHRYGLDDAILIKDNHIAVLGGIAATVERIRATIGHLVKIEIEIDSLDQLDAALEAGVDAILLDNMTPEVLRQAVDRIGGRAVTEASGGITPETAHAVAASGVDLLSAGWITHSAKNMDFGLDF